MISGAKGLLPLLRGSEAYLSVGTGHFTGWVRAIKFGCRTPYKSIADRKGLLSADRFRHKDSRMAKCIDEGYEWRVFPWQAEVAWPRLPDLAQRALNVSHGVTSRSTEVEVMVWVAEAEKGEAWGEARGSCVRRRCKRGRLASEKGRTRGLSYMRSELFDLA